MGERNYLKLFTVLPLPKIMLASEECFFWNKRIKYYFMACLQFIPIAFLMNSLETWFSDSKQFMTFFLIVLIINIFVGVGFHIKQRTFNITKFLVKKSVMVFVCVGVYISLDALRVTIGENVVGDVFRSAVQAMTLAYPIGKIARNVFILTNGEFPGIWLMHKLYDFEKDGDLKKFIDGNVDSNDAGFNEFLSGLKVNKYEEGKNNGKVKDKAETNGENVTDKTD